MAGIGFPASQIGGCRDTLLLPLGNR